MSDVILAEPQQGKERNTRICKQRTKLQPFCRGDLSNARNLSTQPLKSSHMLFVPKKTDLETSLHAKEDKKVFASSWSVAFSSFYKTYKNDENNYL
jgi:hypothetical protein